MGFTRGWTGMLLRDAPGFGIYFALFEGFKRFLRVPEKEKDLANSSSIDIGVRKFIAGGTAGCLTWFVAYPMDSVKSRMQTYEGENRLKLRQVIPEVLRTQGGILTLYRGIHVQLLRAFPTSASSLLVFETLRNYL